MELLNHLFNGIEYYFNAATQLGYVKDSDVEKLLMYICIQELLEGVTRYHVTESDYKIMEQALTCMYGSSCLLPYPQYVRSSNLYGHFEDDREAIVRLRQDNPTRSTEDDRVRFKAYN